MISRNGLGTKTNAQELYDRIAEVQKFAMKLNGYRASVAKYLRSLNLSLDSNSRVLDAGCGTGIVSMAFQDAGFDSKQAVALDLSHRSLKVASREIARRKGNTNNVDSVQANLLQLPFGDGTFDMVMMCGVLEYTPLDAGLSEAARVLKRGAPLVLLPVKPSLVGSVLEVLYDFKIHPLHAITVAAGSYFNVVSSHKFPVTEPISWSKTIFLLEKK
jgi:ubiquinone/menaquinone biosynthesis C-methylase UbiE